MDRPKMKIRGQRRRHYRRSTQVWTAIESIPSIVEAMTAFWDSFCSTFGAVMNAVTEAVTGIIDRIADASRDDYSLA